MPLSELWQRHLRLMRQYATECALPHNSLVDSIEHLKQLEHTP